MPNGKAQLNAGRQPPPLPPRIPSASSYQTLSEVADNDIPPPPYEAIFTQQSGNDYTSLASNDPRSSSTQSLVPSKSEKQGDKRKLLLVYIHGFMGDETSFQSFPAHVHSLVSALVAETHVVHTKLYPRYRSKKKIDFARDDFSRWLAPHEAPTTDVILLGHSMGGLLSAEVALVPSGVNSQLRHHLIGTINFDVPFLGMHPRVVKSGLASVFSPSPQPVKPSTEPGSSNFASPASNTQMQEHGYFDDAKTSRAPPPLPPRGLGSPLSPDPNYNPAFENDVVLPIRKGWRNAWHFINKHSDDLTTATVDLIKSHMEFGGTMADYSGLKIRYARIRALEESNVNVRRSVLGASGHPPRVRFVNYYTSSTGRPKVIKPPLPSETNLEQPAATAESAMGDENLSEKQGESTGLETAGSTLMIDDHEDLETDSRASDDHDPNEVSMNYIDPAPLSESGGDTTDAESWADAVEDHPNQPQENPVEDQVLVETPSDHETTSLTTTENPSTTTLASAPTLPPLPELQPAPAPLDLAAYTDKDARKLAEKDYSRAMKAYDKSVKDRDRAIRDRTKLMEKRERQAIKEGKKAEKEREKQGKLQEKEAKKESTDTKKGSKSKGADQEKIVTLERRETEREWREALNQRWNDDDSTVEPHPGLDSSNDLTIRSSQASIQTAMANEEEGERPMKDYTFCSLPPKDRSGNRDPTWVRVVMKGVDEVGAHCGLFFSDDEERYERFVEEIGEKILEWVNEAGSERIIRELEARG